MITDYIGIKKHMNLALAQYTAGNEQNLEEIAQSVVIVKDQLSLLDAMFHNFDNSGYFSGKPIEQLDCLNESANFVLATEKSKHFFMDVVKRLKSAYDICVGSSDLTQAHKDKIHYYLAVRTIIFKITSGNAPDVEQMNEKVRELVKDALQSDGVEEIFKMGAEHGHEISIFDDDYLDKINQIKQPNTKMELLQQLLKKAIGEFKKTNKVKSIDFSKKMNAIVQKYNERDESNTMHSTVMKDFTDQIIDIIYQMRDEVNSYQDMGIDFEQKA